MKMNDPLQDYATRMQEAHCTIVARCMEWTQRIRIRPQGVCTTVDVLRFVDEIRGIAGQAIDKPPASDAAGEQGGATRTLTATADPAR